MQFITFLSLLATALPSVAAAPTEEHVPIEARLQQGFTITQQATSQKVLVNGPLQRLRAIAKYGGTPSSSLAAAAAQQGSVAANPQVFDSSYLSPVTVGAQTVMLQIDSGSSDLWVFSSKQAAADRAGHSFYQTSPSKRLQGQTWSITYGDGDMAKGIVFADKVVVGGVTATRQAVEAATSVSPRLTNDQNNDGIFGFAFSKLNSVRPNKQLTWFDTIKSTLPKPIWTATLKKQAPGTYDFGYIDPSKYQGEIAWRPIDSPSGFWQFKCAGYFVGSQEYSQGPDTFPLIADTGTSLILLKPADVQNYYSQVPNSQDSSAQGGYIFPCNTTLPDFTLSIEGRRRRVPGSYINYGPLGDGSCYGGIQSGLGDPFGILGDVFLKSQYVIFDTSVPRIGFAQQKGIPDHV